MKRRDGAATRPEKRPMRNRPCPVRSKKCSTCSRRPFGDLHSGPCLTMNARRICARGKKLVRSPPTAHAPTPPRSLEGTWDLAPWPGHEAAPSSRAVSPWGPLSPTKAPFPRRPARRRAGRSSFCQALAERRMTAAAPEGWGSVDDARARTPMQPPATSAPPASSVVSMRARSPRPGTPARGEGEDDPERAFTASPPTVPTGDLVGTRSDSSRRRRRRLRAGSANRPRRSCGPIRPPSACSAPRAAAQRSSAHLIVDACIRRASRSLR